MKPEIIIALCALVTSAVSLVFSIYFGWCTRDHNKRTVKPLPYVSPSDFKDLLAIRIWNYGNGPLVLNKVMHCDEQHQSDHIIDLLPPLPGGIYFSNYVKVRSGRAIPPGKSLTLFEFIVDEANMKAIAYRDQLRETLGNLVMHIGYTDIYETKFPILKRDFKWFHRDRNANEALQPIARCAGSG